jgi:hypothetical protein
MSLSSNTLTHFTERKEALLGILQENFKIFFCKETVHFGEYTQRFFCPMVSFCDIPMSEIKNHIKKYGNYGIGLTKEWAVKNGLNPVLYVAQHSTLSQSYRTAMRHFVIDKNTATKNTTNEAMALLDIIRYMKNYEGPLERKNQSIASYRFSDEREWRYVPKFTKLKEMIATKATYEINQEKYSMIYNNDRLKFEPNDIKYIIIKDDSEIKEIISHLRNAKGRNYSYDDIERLTTRILTIEQIMGDF